MPNKFYNDSSCKNNREKKLNSKKKFENNIYSSKHVRAKEKLLLNSELQSKTESN